MKTCVPLYRNKIILMRFDVQDDEQNQHLFSVYLTRFELNRPNKSDFNIIKSAFSTSIYSVIIIIR